MASSYRKKYSWTQSDDTILSQCYRQYHQLPSICSSKMCKWKTISYLYNTSDSEHKRDAKQCRERFTNHLREGIVNKSFSEEEFNLLEQLVAKYGHQWSAFAKYHFPNRSSNKLKNKWHAHLRKKQPNHNKDDDVDEDFHLSISNRVKRKRIASTSTIRKFRKVEPKPTSNWDALIYVCLYEGENSEESIPIKMQ